MMDKYNENLLTLQTNYIYMKTIRILLILLCCTAAVTLASCEKTSAENETDITDKEVQEYEKYLDPQKVSSYRIPIYEVYKTAYEEASGGNGSEEDEMIAQWAKVHMDAMYKQAEEYANKQGGNDLSPAINAWLEDVLLEVHTFTYNTKGADGKDVRLSSLIAWPWGLIWNPRPEYVILGTHCTIGSNDERPTNYDNLKLATDVRIIVGQWASSSTSIELGGILTDLILDPAECLVVMPDYEGYGNTSDRPQPYLNREVQARQCVDAVQAGIIYCRKENKELTDGWKIISMGYSQGGALAAASYRHYLENKTTRYKGMPWAGALCGDGPYDPFQTLSYYVLYDILDMPCAPALVIKGMVDTDPEMIAAGVKLSDYLTPEFIETGIFEGIDSKNKTTSQLDEMVYSYIKNHPDGKLKLNPEYSPSRIVMTSTVLLDDVYAYIKGGGMVPSKVSEERKKKLELLGHCLRKNALFYKSYKENWTPPADAKFTFFHAPGDKVVPDLNLTSVRQAWGDEWGSSSAHARYILFEAGVDGHTDVGTQFMLGSMIPETYKFIKGTWKAGYERKTDKAWKP